MAESQIVKARHNYTAEDASLYPSLNLVGIQQFFGEPDQPPNRGFSVDMWLNGFGSTTMFSSMHGITTEPGINGSYGTWVLGGAYNTNTLARERIVELNLAFSNGNISEIHYQLYGMKV